MEGQYSWKRTEDIEIDLADLIRRLCRQWKKIAVCAVVCALVLGWYDWMKGRNVPDEGYAGEEAALTEAEEQAVANAVRLKNEIQRMETYLENSLLMQIEPYHKNKFVMLYSISSAKRQELAEITESYLSFVQNGGAADALKASGSSWKMDKSCLAEVISAYQKTYSFPYQIAVDNMEDKKQMAEALFYVETVGRDADEAEKLSADMQRVIRDYSARVEEAAGSHRLKLVSIQKSVTADSGLLSQQRDRRAALSSDRSNLKTITDAFSQEQRDVYKKLAGVADDQKEDAPREDGADSGQGYSSVIKYMILGVVAGIFAYCGIYSCWYVFRDTLKTAEEMKRLYTFPVYGELKLAGAGKGEYANGELQVWNRIRLACKKQGIVKLYAASDFLFSAPERDCLERIAGQLRGFGVNMSVAENAGADTAVWDSLAETGSVFLVCRLGTTTRRMIDEAMEFYLQNGTSVAGAVVFGQNG